MVLRLSLAQIAHTVAVRPEEAVAVIQQLIHQGPETRALVHAPFGPPTLDNVYASDTGDVVCESADATFAVSEIAALLDAMLRVGATAVSGSLRYAIARARLEVDAPPFDSLDDLSHTLARYERGERAAAIRNLVVRATLSLSSGREPGDRRRADPAVTRLRRQLRDADARAYEQQRAIDALGALVTPRPAASRRFAIAAALFAGVTLIGAGELMRHPAMEAESPPARVAESVAAPATTVASERVPQPPSPPRAASMTPRAAKTEDRDAPPKRVIGVRATARDRTAAPAKRGFRWLPKRIVFRTDPL